MAQIPENWLPWPRAGKPFVPTKRPAGYSPYSLDAGEQGTRFYGNVAPGPFPYPTIIGAVSGFMPFLDELSRQFAYAKNAYGPGVLTPVPWPETATFPMLPKVTA